mmetsp:Transcript_23845/g.55317  ORF Transcript_23845/g.55317 Transcript_23845/m.55317 type:complete len:201 (-) Transcript_23845:4983-5585(-)
MARPAALDGHARDEHHGEVAAVVEQARLPLGDILRAQLDLAAWHERHLERALVPAEGLDATLSDSVVKQQRTSVLHAAPVEELLRRLAAALGGRLDPHLIQGLLRQRREGEVQSGRDSVEARLEVGRGVGQADRAGRRGGGALAHLQCEGGVASRGHANEGLGLAREALFAQLERRVGVAKGDAAGDVEVGGRGRRLGHE